MFSNFGVALLAAMVFTFGCAKEEQKEGEQAKANPTSDAAGDQKPESTKVAEQEDNDDTENSGIEVYQFDPTKSESNLKQIAIGLHTYSAKSPHGEFAEYFVNDEGEKLLSWRCWLALIAEMPGSSAPGEFNRTLPWDHATNKPHSLSAGREWGELAEKTGKTRYLMVIPPGREKELQPFPKRGNYGYDKMAEHIIAVEVAPEKAVPWMKPVDFILDEKDPFKNLGYKPGEKFLAMMVDGSVKELNTDMDADKFRKMCSIPE